MADRGDTHYSTSKLNLWFTVSAVLLLIAAVWMVLDDWNRPWKQYQREFRTMEIERARERLAEADAVASLAREEELQGTLSEAEARLAQQQDAIQAAEDELVLLDADLYNKTTYAKKVKQNYNWDRWEIEEKRLHKDDPTFEATEIAETEAELAAAQLAQQDAEALVAAKQAEIAQLKAAVTTVEDEIKAATKNIDLARTKLAAIAPEDAPTKVANIIRDFPGLDFIGPSIVVKKVLPPNLTFELNFTKKPRIDMCQTCHLPIENAGFEDEEHPFKSHPNLDLYLSAKSPHPTSAVGCTICHRGSGEALDFLRVDHRPSDEEEGKEWYDEYHWHKKHYWDYPMLSSEHIEASCIQCHKDSMELIADDAPQVTEGYRLFERYGCYACHKVEWYPTKRKPGPSLKGIAQKTDKEFVAQWIKDPKAFRPSTWMPQIFHLENYAPDQVIAKSEYGTGRDIMGDEWSDAALASVSAFIMSRASEEEAAPIPVEGDAERGREVFRVAGCLACHNMAPYPGAEPENDFDPALMQRDENEHGPNLRGIATKVTPEWLFAWIKDPSAYWSETRMPDLRLPDQDIADIVAYMTEDPDGYFGQVPEGWVAGDVAYKRDVLEEQARWFFNRTLKSELDRRFAEEWSDDQALLEVIGERFVLAQGCHSCHEISGLEDAQPIGTELTNWGSKTVDKLDFGLIPEILAQKHGWSHHDVEEFKQYREGWLEQKLAAPRSFDQGKIKNPTERLKMPWFDFDEQEISAISTFVVGLVDDEVSRAKMVPSAAQAQMNHGLQVLRQKNCAACHAIEPGTIRFHDEDGVAREVKGQILAFEDEVLPPPMDQMDDFQAYLADYVAAMRADLEDDEFDVEEVIVQLLEPSPELGLSAGQNVTIEDVASIETDPAWGGALVDLVTGDYLYNEDVEDVDGERRSFLEESYEKVRWTYAPPVLWDEGSKLQREWFYRFLMDPLTLRESIRVRMPTFNWAEGEAGAVADYFAHQAAADYPRKFARNLLLRLDKSPEDVVLEMSQLGLPALSVPQLQGILDGKKPETDAGFSKLLAYGDAIEFELEDSVDPSYETIVQRTPAHLEPLMESGDFFTQVRDLAVGPNGPNCVQCHFLEGDPPTNETPIGWAPDLAHTKERLRPDWVREWLTDPSKIYPGTAMPANFATDDQWQEAFEGTGAEQIEAVITWLYNLDRARLTTE